MRHNNLLKPIYSSMILTALSFMHLVSASANTYNQPVNENDITETLVDLQRKDIDVGNTAPTANISVSETKAAIKERGSLKSAQRYDLKALKSDPVAFTKYLNMALAAQDMQTVKELLPHYKAMQVIDPMLIKFADALVYRSEGKNKQAIAIYKKMLAENPSFHPVRLNMAQALYSDKQYSASLDQLQKLKGAQIPQPVMKTVNSLITRIEKSEKWRFNASLSYIYDDNLNGVPEKPIQIQNGNGTLTTGGNPESGSGLQASLGAHKRINLNNNLYANVGGNAFLKGYWDNSEYNDYFLTASAGVGYDDALHDISVTPFVTKRFYSEDPYSMRSGVTIKGSRWLSPKTKLTASSIISNEKYDEKKDKNRETDGLFVGLNALYLKDADEYFYGGLGHYNNDVPKVDLLTYDRNSVNVGWGKEWNQGLSTLATLGYTIKEYEKTNLALLYGGKLGSAREDKTTTLGLQVWKRDINMFGLTPRFVFDYETTSSNFEYYDDRDDIGATIVLTKTF